MAAPNTPRSALERGFERKVTLSRWALWFEQLWPRAWALLGLAGLVIAVSLLGVWARLGDFSHKLVLGLFGLAVAVALLALARVRWPSREEAIRRVEGVSGVKHRPASSYEDTLTLNAEDSRTAALLATLRGGRPAARTDRSDPFAVRALLLLAVLLLLIAEGDSTSDGLWSAF